VDVSALGQVRKLDLNALGQVRKLDLTALGQVEKLNLAGYTEIVVACSRQGGGTGSVPLHWSGGCECSRAGEGTHAVWLQRDHGLLCSAAGPYCGTDTYLTDWPRLETAAAALGQSDYLTSKIRPSRKWAPRTSSFFVYHPN